jgi:hypothetical protein
LALLVCKKTARKPEKGFFGVLSEIGNCIIGI